MTSIAITGACGKMGRVIAGLCSERNDCEVIAGIDIAGDEYGGFPIYRSVFELPEKPDVIIDFSHPSALADLLNYGKINSVGLVIATTGYTDEQRAEITKASSFAPIFFTFNMSIGINLLTELAVKAASVLSESFDIEIVEKHHNRKKDAPSGTAIMIAESINEKLSGKKRFVYDRHNVRRARGIDELGIHSVRGGTIVGEHEVIFAGHDEVITITHSAQSKEVFASGALNAAVFLAGKPNGLYTMNDLIKEE